MASFKRVSSILNSTTGLKCCPLQGQPWVWLSPMHSTTKRSVNCLPQESTLWLSSITLRTLSMMCSMVMSASTSRIKLFVITSGTKFSTLDYRYWSPPPSRSMQTCWTLLQFPPTTLSIFVTPQLCYSRESSLWQSGSLSMATKTLWQLFWRTKDYFQ